MTDAQNWTLIIGFLAVLIAVVTFTSTMTLRVVRAELRTLGAELGGRMGLLEAKVDLLDRDVQTVVNRLMDG